MNNSTVDIVFLAGTKPPHHLSSDELGPQCDFTCHWHESDQVTPNQIFWDGFQLRLMHRECKNLGQALSWDWHKEWEHLRQQGGHLTGPFARALRCGRGLDLRVLDCTLGSGKDACFFIAMGLEVLAFERRAQAFLLARDAWHRSHTTAPHIWQKIDVRYGDARHASKGHFSPDIIYCDPMYGEEHNSKGRSRMAMEVYHQLAGHDQDRAELWNWALAPEQGGRKVILKRALRAEVFAKPTAIFKGKSTRYDVYFKN